MDKGLIHIYYGNGKGKTTSALGLALRALGNDMRVYLVQFLKDNNSGEIKSLCEFSNFTLLENKKKFDFFWNLNEVEKRELKNEIHLQLAEIEKVSKNNTYDLIVLDEILGAIENNLIDEEKVIEIISKRHKSIELVITGRKVSSKLIQMADYVSKIQSVKHPYDIGIQARKGIEY